MEGDEKDDIFVREICRINAQGIHGRWLFVLQVLFLKIVFLLG